MILLIYKKSTLQRIYKQKCKNGKVMVTAKILQRWQFTFERQPFLRYLLDKSGGKYRARRQGHPYETRAS